MEARFKKRGEDTHKIESGMENLFTEKYLTILREALMLTRMSDRTMGM